MDKLKDIVLISTPIALLLSFILWLYAYPNYAGVRLESVVSHNVTKIEEGTEGRNRLWIAIERQQAENKRLLELILRELSKDQY